MDAAAEFGRNLVSKQHQIDDSALALRMSRLMRDRTAEPVSRDQIIRRERGQGNKIFPVKLTTSRIDNLYPVVP